MRPFMSCRSCGSFQTDMEQHTVIFVELCSKETNISKLKTLRFPSFPPTFQVVKEEIEKCCFIPVCVQTMWYQSMEVADNCSPSSLYMRGGDTVKVIFPHIGECEKVKMAVQWLGEVSPILEVCKVADTPEFGQYSNILEDKKVTALLARKLFDPWTDKTKQVNCSQFISLNGVDLLFTFHRHAIELRKSNKCEFACSLSNYYEVICCQTIATLAMYFTYRRQLSRCQGLEQCIDSFLIKPADDERLLFNHFIIVKVALYAICNISEVPEVQQWISEKSDVIQQALIVAKSPRYTCNTATMAVSLLLCLAQCPEAHVNLLKPDTVNELIEACEIRRKEQTRSEVGDICDVMALECYTAVVLAQMICGSTSLLQTFPFKTLKIMVSLMDIVCSYDPEEIRTYEINQGFVWGTFLPYLTFLYTPDPDVYITSCGAESSPSLIVKLRHQACNVLLLCLQNTLGRQNHVDTLVEEDLLDFLVAMIWNISPESQEIAKKVYKEVAKFQQIQPPSLCSLAKAKLAKTKWGLKKMRDMKSVSHLLNAMI